MRALLLWLRRGTSLLVLPTLVGFLLATSASTHPWLLDADWGVRYTSAAVFIFAPLVAAVAAYDVSRRVHPTLAHVARGSVRGAAALLLPVAAAVVWAVAASAVSWTVIWTAVSLSAGIGPRDPWVYAETAAAYLAAAAVGALVGHRAKGVAGAAFAAGLVLIVGTVLAGWGVKAFQVASSSGTMIGIERTPVRAGLAIALNLSIALLCLAALRLTTGVSRPSRVALAAVALPLAAVLVMHVALPIRDSEYRPTREAQACVGDAPVVCGPEGAARLLQKAQRDLAQARLALRESQLPLPERFAIARGDAVRSLGPSVAELSYDPSALVDGHLRREALVQALAAPRVCDALFHESTAPEYLDYLSEVGGWLDGQLQATAAGLEPAPASVQAAYAKLSTCETPSQASR